MEEGGAGDVRRIRSKDVEMSSGKYGRIGKDICLDGVYGFE